MINTIFKEISLKSQNRLTFILGILTFLLLLSLNMIDSSLKTAEAPNGIVSFELAMDFSSSQKMISSWNSEARLYAALSLGIDYLFLFAYSLFMAMLTLRAADFFESRNNLLKKAGYILAPALLFAGLFDAIENYALIRILFGQGNEIYSLTAFCFAAVKFLIIIFGFIYLFTALIFWIISKKA